jgi:hypothetical protein
MLNIRPLPGIHFTVSAPLLITHVVEFDVSIVIGDWALALVHVVRAIRKQMRTKPRTRVFIFRPFLSSWAEDTQSHEPAAGPGMQTKIRTQ